MKKMIVLMLVLLLAIPMSGCLKEDVVLDEMKEYAVSSDIHSLDISINAATFSIKLSDKIAIESNLKYLLVKEENGVLTIFEEARRNADYRDAELILYLPANVIYENVSIETGAAAMNVETLSAVSLTLGLGAGNINFKHLNVTQHADIEGGAGEINILDGTLNNLNLEMGIGELNMTAALLGSNQLEFGVGDANLTILGSKDDYRMDIEKGIGSVTVDGQKVTDFGSSGNGKNFLEIDSGIGAVNLKFQETE